MTSSTTDVALEARLRALSVDAPPTLVARVLATAAVMPGDALPRRRSSVRRRIAVGAVALVIFVGGNSVAAHLIPAYASILHRIPIAGALLANTGLTSSTDVVPANDTSIDDGYTLRVVGSYADRSGTTVLLSVKGPAGGDPPDMLGTTTRLTDQFGTTDTLNPHDLGSGDFALAPPWNWSLNFEPLLGVAANSTVLVTMRIRGLSTTAPTDRTASWQLRFRVTELPSLPATTPAPIQLGSDHFTFHPVVATDARIDVTFTQTGNESPFPSTAFSAEPEPTGVLCTECVAGVPVIMFYGPDGQRYQDLEGGAWPTTAKTSEASVWFASDGPGTYRLTLTAVNGDSVQETFVVGGGSG
jgi:hypothetical protein